MNKTLQHCDDLIRDVETHLSRLDHLLETEKSSKRTIADLELAIFDLHKNTADLPQKERATKLTSSMSFLLIEKSDLASLQVEISNTKSEIARCDHIAREQLKALTWELQQARKFAVETKLSTLINFGKLLLSPADFSRCAYSVLEVVDAGNMIAVYRLRNDVDGSVADARQLREFASPLLAWCAEEKHLVLDDVKSADLLPSAMAELATV